MIDNSRHQAMAGARLGGWAALAVILLVWQPASAQTNFKQDQLEHSRVRAAFASKEPLLRAAFNSASLSYPPQSLFLRIFKKEKRLEAWVGESGGGYRLAKTFEICASSGKPGPKRRRGDLQVPEGFYHISDFNPRSNFFLSLGISYPNRSDQIRKNGGDPGGAIYIHGDCVTIGCVPINDDGIMELYVLAVEARAGGQRQIPVHIFPARMDSLDYRLLAEEYSHEPDLVEFWRNLKVGYDYFQSTGRLPRVTIDRKGEYHFE